MTYGVQNALWYVQNVLRIGQWFPERLNAECLPPRFKLNQEDGKFLVELLLIIRGDAINLTLQMVSTVLRISEAPGRGICLSIRLADQKMQWCVGHLVWHPIGLVFGGSYP